MDSRQGSDPVEVPESARTANRD